MINIDNVTKTFDDIKAVDGVSVTIKEGNVFGLLGTNGAGKSTLLRMVTGILKPDDGRITVDDMKVYNNPKAKSNMFFVSDTPYFFANGTPLDMESYIKNQYPEFDSSKYAGFLKMFITIPGKPVFSPKTKLLKLRSIIMSALPESLKYFITDMK